MRNKENKKLRSQKLKRGSVASGITCIGIAIVIVLNLILFALSNKYNLSLDLTNDQSFTLTSQSIDYIKGINKDVEITLLSDEETFKNTNEYFAKAHSVLSQYSKYSDKIKITYVDVAKNPIFASNYADENLTTNSVIVKSGDKKRILTVNDLFDISSSYYGKSITASNAEQALTSAIVYVLNGDQVKAIMITGYGEQDSSNFENLLKKNNYDVESVSILTGEIPESASLAVLYAPERDIDQSGINKIEAFLSKGNKNLMYVANPALGERTNLNKVLEKWGVQLEDGVVYETSQDKLLLSNNLFYHIADYVDETYTEGLKNTSIPVSIPFSKAIKVTDAAKAKTLLECSKTAGTIASSGNKEPDFSKTTGPISVATISNNGAENSSKVAVVGSYFALENQFTSLTSLNNSAYFMNMINVMTDKKDDGIVIESKQGKSQEMSINAGQARMLFVFFDVVIPIAIIVVGVLVYRKRKNR